MLRAFRYSYILAKIYGMLAKSYIGENYREILRLRKIGEVYDLLFPGERKDVPEYQLTSELERKVVEASIRSMIRVLDLLGTPEPILVHLLRKYEYQALKSVIRSIGYGRPGTEASTPVPTGPGAAEGARVWDLGRYAGVDLAGSKDYRKAIAHSPYDWVVPLLATTPIVRIESMLDRDYYLKLQKLARALPPKDRAGVSRLVEQEAALMSAVWALRLRFFFGLDAEKAREFLIPRLLDGPRRAVMQAFEIPSDSLEGWRRWKFGWLVEDQLSETFQVPDPIRAEQAATRQLYIKAHRLFHQDPFTLTPLVAFFKLKEYEANLLSTAAEALRLSVSEEEILAMMGAQ